MSEHAAGLVAALETAAHRWPDRTAWVFDPGRSFTFAEVDELTVGFAGALHRRGVRPGDRVGVLLRNQPEFPLVWFALMRLGATMVPLNVKYRSVDLAHVLETASVAAVVSTGEFTELLAGAPGVLLVEELEPDPTAAPRVSTPTAPANIQFTSGTTGRPKGCVLSQEYWLRLGRSLVDEFPRLSADDVMLTAQPFHYIDPQWNVVAALLAGARLVVLDGFHPSTFWQQVRHHDVTYFYCLGAMPTLLLRMPADPGDRTHRVRVVQASAIPPALHAQLEERWGVGWYEAFGMTETGADLRVTEADHDALVGTGCLGRPAGHREAKVVDGQLLLRGPGMMDGYLGEPDPFVDGWFATGDLAEVDAEGRFYHRGRTKDMIRRSGENIAAHEVEDVLTSHPGVRLAAVVGVPDEIRGEEVKAFVVGDVGEAELATWCAERLASFKVPRFWEFRDDLPRTASERVVKAGLR
ncbi:AMP-binding protein [Nocardioides marmoraquaticus]